MGEAVFDVAIDYGGSNGHKLESELEQKWTRAAAALNLDLAELKLGNSCLQGKGVRRNLVDGLAWLGIARSQLQVAGNEYDRLVKEAPLPEGLLPKVDARVTELRALKQATGGYYEDPFYASPVPRIEELSQLVDDGVPLAQVRLAYAYEKGQGVSPDLSAAVKLYKQVEQDGPMELHVHLGISYLEGDGVEQDYEQARGWLILATDEGSGRAARLLGEMDRDGKGRDDASAMYAAMWFGLAEADPLAKNELGDLEAKLTPEEKQKAADLAKTWKMKHPQGLH